MAMPATATSEHGAIHAVEGPSLVRPIVVPPCSLVAADWHPIVVANMQAAGFTRREREVGWLLLAGSNDPLMADGLCISFQTVKTHLRHMRQKTGTTTRTQLALVLLGIIEPREDGQ